MPPTPGELTFAVNRKLLAGGLVVSDAQVREAMRQAFLRFKIGRRTGRGRGLGGGPNRRRHVPQQDNGSGMLWRER